MSDYNKNPLATPEDCSKGGKARAAKLTPEQRKAIATKSSHSRKCYENIAKATHFGKLDIGGIEITCAVLEDGRSVITETSLFKLFGMRRGGRNKKLGGAQMPRFLSANNLQTHIPEGLKGGAESFDIVLPQGGKAYAYEAEKVPLILKTYLEARRSGVLTPSQIAIAATAEIIMIALGQIGIVSLIHEATGYEKVKDKDLLQKLFSAFIAKELQPWVSRFPPGFFFHMRRMYGLEQMKKNPPFFGHLINRWVYDELSPEIRAELQKINPVTEAGYRKHRHHQFLTQSIGCPALEKQVMKVETLMSVSKNRDEFESLLERSKIV